jgi:hypothetical protein
MCVFITPIAYENYVASAKFDVESSDHVEKCESVSFAFCFLQGVTSLG